jgi:hypothetical protein
MRTLTIEEIRELANRKNVRKIAVENFLMSLGGQTSMDALLNLEMDARLYKWNNETMVAIHDGILLADRSKGM